MPKSNQEDARSFFEASEKIAHELERPEGNWTLLIQSVLESKAQEGNAALEHEQSKDYDVVRGSSFSCI